MGYKHIPGTIKIGKKCNHKCLFCSIPNFEESYTQIKEIEKRIYDLKDQGTTDLIITGGEPFVINSIFDIVEIAKKYNFNEITIQTNASKISKEIAKEIKNKGNVKFNVSFHSHNKNVSNKLSGTNNFDDVVEGIKNAVNEKIPLSMTIVINKLNYKNLINTIKFVENNFKSVRHFSLNYVDPTNHALINSDIIVPTLFDSQKYIKCAVDYILKKGMSFRLERVPLCYMQGFEEYSTEIRLTGLNEKRMTYFSEKGRDKAKKEKNIQYIKSDVCNNCYLKELCPGLNPKYILVHGIEELYPSFENPNKIIQRMKKTRMRYKND